MVIEILEVFVRIVGWNVDCFGNGRVDIRLHRLHHGHMVGCRHFQRIHKIGRQWRVARGPVQRTVQAIGMVFDGVFAGGAVRLTLFACIRPREGRFNAVGCIVGKRQTHRACRRNGKQVAVAQAIFLDGVLDVIRQTAGKTASAQIGCRIELGESTLFLGQFDRGPVSGIAHALGNACGHLAAVFAVVAQTQHRQRVAQSGKTNADAALGLGFFALLGQWPPGHIEHVVQRTHLHRHGLFKRLKIESGGTARAKRVAHESRQDDRPQVTTSVIGQWLFTAGIGGCDGFAIVQIVVAVDLIQEQDTRFGKIVGRLHDGVPQFARRHLAVHPLPVGALASTIVKQFPARFGLVHQFPLGIVRHRLHESIGHANRHVEIVPAPWGALGGDELKHVGVVDAQHAHLGAAARPGALDRGTALVKHIDIAARAAGDRMRALDLCPLGTNAGKIVADAASAPHGLCRLAQCLINARITLVVRALNRVAHRLHKTVDQRSLNISAARAHDASGANGSSPQIDQEFLLPFLLQL